MHNTKSLRVAIIKTVYELRITRREAALKLDIAERLWVVRPRRALESNRAACLGELVHIGSPYHDWFEGRAAPSGLLVMIDDASGHLMHLQFVNDQSVVIYLTAVREYPRRHDRPFAFTSDNHAEVRTGDLQSSQDKLTRFAQALTRSGVELQPGHHRAWRNSFIRLFNR